MNKVKFLVAALFGVLFVACSEEENLSQTGKTGFIVSLANGSVGVETRTAPRDLNIPVTEFTLKIANELTPNKPFYDKKLTSNEETITDVPNGMYNLSVSYGDNVELGWDKPYFYGDTTGVEVAGRMTPVTIACKVANSLVSVFYDDSKASFDDVYSDYYVEVKVGNETPLQITKGEKRSAYFRAGSKFGLVFHGTLIENGTEKQLSLNSDFDIPSTLVAGEHLKLTLSPQLDKYNIPLKIETVAVDTATLEESIPVSWLPKPKIAGFNEDGATSVSHIETATANVPAVLNFSGTMPVEDVELTLDLKDEDFASLNKTYLLTSLSEEDRTALTNAGIVLPDLGEKTGSIDFSALAKSLKIASGSETVHNIKLRVKANDRWSSEESAPSVFEIHTLAPKITVTANPEDIWSKSLTVSGATVESGDEATIKNNLKYQFNDNGTWKDCDENNLAMLANHPSDYKMQVRAVYRDVVECEPTTFDLEVPEQLPNSDMEEWSYEITDDSRNALTKNLDYVYWKKWFPWNSVSTPSVWNTVNQTTTQYGDNPTILNTGFLGTYPTPPYVGCCYVANSGTIPVEGDEAYNGKSALLKTVGWGKNNDAKAPPRIQYVSPAELYLGTYDLSSHQPIYGIDYESRPTAVKFWCKYVPKSTDLMIAQIVVMDESGEIIGNASISDSEAGATDWTEKTLNIQYVTPYKKAVKMYISFKSGTITDTDVMDKPSFGNLSDGESVGSKLYIDDIELVYDK